MRAYIHYTGGQPFNEECAVAQKGFEKLGVECVPFSTNEELDTANREDVVVAGVLVTGHALARWGVEPPSIDYPEELQWLLGRRVWKSTIGRICKTDLPLFVKPARDKELPAVVARCMDDLAAYETMGPGYPVLCSESIEFSSEWRVFVRYGKIADVRCYLGEPHPFPDVDAVNGAVESYSQSPAAYTLDLGVTSDGRTLLVEVNDGYSVGCYGADCVAYALFLAARWAELVSVEDELSDLNCSGNPSIPWPERDFDAFRLESLLGAVEGSTEQLVCVAPTVAEWNGIGAQLVRYLEDGKRSHENVWRWLAEKTGLKTHGVEGKEYVFPRAQTVRYAVELGRSATLGSAWLNRFDNSSTGVFSYLDVSDPELRRELDDIILDYLEDDAREFGFDRIFTLVGDDEPGKEQLYASRGYLPVPEKDEEDLARALGAHVIHDRIVEKDLTKTSA